MPYGDDFTSFSIDVLVEEAFEALGFGLMAVAVAVVVEVVAIDFGGERTSGGVVMSGFDVTDDDAEPSFISSSGMSYFVTLLLLKPDPAGRLPLRGTDPFGIGIALEFEVESVSSVGAVTRSQLPEGRLAPTAIGVDCRALDDPWDEEGRGGIEGSCQEFELPA